MNWMKRVIALVLVLCLSTTTLSYGVGFNEHVSLLEILGIEDHPLTSITTSILEMVKQSEEDETVDVGDVLRPDEINRLNERYKRDQYENQLSEKSNRYIVKFVDDAIKKKFLGSYAKIEDIDKVVNFEGVAENLVSIQLSCFLTRESFFEDLSRIGIEEKSVDFLVFDRPIQVMKSDFGETEDDIVSLDASISKKVKSDLNSVTVALIGDGLDTEHYELKESLLIDKSWDFVQDKKLENSEDEQGTAVAGIISAKQDGVGVDGVYSNAKLMALDVVDKDTTYTSRMIEALVYAEKNGAEIVNMSWWTYESNLALFEVMKASEMLFVCAAGDGSSNLSVAPVYPAAYQLNNVLSVASTDQEGRLSFFSNDGFRTVDIATLGEEIVTTLPNQTYGMRSGTSYAAAAVTAYAASILGNGICELGEVKALVLADGVESDLLLDKVIKGRYLDLNATQVFLSLEIINGFRINTIKDKMQLLVKPFKGTYDFDSNKEQVTDLETSKALMLNWLKKQQMAPTYDIKISFDESYEEKYQGEVTGAVDLSLLDSKWVESPEVKILRNKSGLVGGTWSNVKDYENYRIYLYDQSDIEYYIKDVPLRSDGTWTADNVKVYGNLKVYLMSKDMRIVAVADEPALMVDENHQIWLYATSDIPYLQGVVQLRSDGTFASQPIPGFGENLNIIGYYPTVHNGLKVARLVETSDESVVSTTEVPKYQLIRSFEVPEDDPFRYNGIDRRSWIYDDALAVIAFSMAGEQEQASQILASLKALQGKDGSLEFAYDVYLGNLNASKRTGAIAWVGYATVYYEKTFGDRRYRPMAEKIASYMLQLQSKTMGSFKGGPDVSWYSTEHNIDAYFFMRDLYEITGNETYKASALAVRQALLTQHWSESNGYFYQGIGDPALALDASSWGGIFSLAIGDDAKAASAMAKTDMFYVSNQVMPRSFDNETYNTSFVSNEMMSGYKPYSADEFYPNAPEIIWTEGTWGVISLSQRLNKNTDELLKTMFDIQSAHPEGAIVYANKGYSPYPYQFHVWPAVAGTAWGYMTLSDNNFWTADSEMFKGVIASTDKKPSDQQSFSMLSTIYDKTTGVVNVESLNQFIHQVKMNEIDDQTLADAIGALSAYDDRVLISGVADLRHYQYIRSIPLTPINVYFDQTGDRRSVILKKHQAGSDQRNRTEFPVTWSEDRIMHQITDVARDPNAERGVANNGLPYAIAVRDGVKIKVYFYSDTHKTLAGKISIGYPLDMPKNPR